MEYRVAGDEPARSGRVHDASPSELDDLAPDLTSPVDAEARVELERHAASQAPSGCAQGVAPARLPAPLHSAAAVAAPNGVIYLVGGNDDHGNSLEPARLVAYDPAERTYRELPAAPERFFTYAGSAFSNGKLIALDRKLWLFDPATERWSEGSPVPYVLTNRAAAVSGDGRVYFFGGYSDVGVPVERADVYDPASDTWQNLPDMPFWGDGLAAAESGGRFYVMGRKAAVFDPQTQQWTLLPPQPTPRHWTTASTDAQGRVINLTGYGYDPIGFTTAMDIYDPRSETWSVGPAMPMGIGEAPSVRACNGAILVFGGESYDGVSDRVHAFTSQGTWLTSE